MPMIANKNWSKRRRSPSEPMAGRATTMVSKMIWSLWKRLMILSTRSTRKTRTMVACMLRLVSELNNPMPRARRDPMTTMKSN